MQGQPQSSVRQSVARRSKLPIISSFVRPKSKGGNERPECGVRRPFSSLCRGIHCRLELLRYEVRTSHFGLARGKTWCKYHCNDIQQVQSCTQMSWDCCVGWRGIPIFSVIVRIEHVAALWVATSITQRCEGPVGKKTCPYRSSERRARLHTETPVRTGTRIRRPSDRDRKLTQGTASEGSLLVCSNLMSMEAEILAGLL